MLDDIFLSALQKTTAGVLDAAGLVEAAGALVAAGQRGQAQQLYAIWIKFNPEHPQLFVAQFNSASLLSQDGDLSGAADCLMKAVAQNPEFLPAYINLGGLLEKSGAVEQALGQWHLVTTKLASVKATAVTYKLTALKQMGRVLSEHRRHAEAEVALRECLSLDTRQREVTGQLLGLRLAQCRWPAVQPWEGVDRATLMDGFLPLSMAAYTDDPLLQLACADRYVSDLPGPTEPSPHDRRAAPIDTTTRRLRIGYVSSDLRDHAIGYLMSEVFELHNKADVEVFAYYCGSTVGDALSRRIQSAVEHWVDIRQMSDDEAAERIAADGIDVLVDVNGHTKDARTQLFARRPAPVQVNWLGYPGTMGSPQHHYIIADNWIIPPESEIYYSEKVVRLPCYQPNDRKRVVAEQRPTRRDAGLPEDAFVFCSFNASHKLGRFTFDRWMEILQRTPGSVLWMIESDEGTHERLRGYAEAAGVASDRLFFARKLANAHHLARYALADLFLDTVPYGAHTTASDALWMGVPVLTLSGRSFASRVCGSLVRSAGLPELVCTNVSEYVDRAVALATDRAALAAHRVRLQFGRHSCVLFDMEGLVSRLEGLYRTMALEHQAGRTPQPDLTNLPTYYSIGAAIDHEAVEMLTVRDYHGLYRQELAKRHALRPLPSDPRLWTAEEVAAADRAGRPPPADARELLPRAVGA